MNNLTRRKVIEMGALGIGGIFAGLTATFRSQAAELRGPLPEFVGIDSWLNGSPLKAADLRGKVVGVQFWTLGCINCQRTLPHITQLYDQYVKQGFVLIGVHTPEFPYERDVNNIQAAIKQHGIKYPVAVDNQFRTWKAFNNQYWPHLFLADKKGQIRYDHIGEGAYDEIDATVQTLLAEV